MKIQTFTTDGKPAGQIDIPAKVMQAAFLLGGYMREHDITELQGLRLSDGVERLRKIQGLDKETAECAQT